MGVGFCGRAAKARGVLSSLFATAFPYVSSYRRKCDAGNRCHFVANKSERIHECRRWLGTRISRRSVFACVTRQ